MEKFLSENASFLILKLSSQSAEAYSSSLIREEA